MSAISMTKQTVNNDEHMFEVVISTSK